MCAQVHVPTQELLHRKKCLLADGKEAAAAPADYGAPSGEPLTQYQPQPTYSG